MHVVDLDEVARAARGDVLGREARASKRLRSQAWTSTPGSPSTSQRASARPTPQEWVTQTASATQNPRTDGCSPISGMPSGVKEKMPLKPLSSPAAARSGSSATASSQDGAKSSGVNSRTLGIPPSVSAPTSTGIGRWA
jgi:hypothetical protein